MDEQSPFVFAGFQSPHYTQVPDDFFDVLLHELTPAEFKVCAYIVRRTFGWKKDSDTISLSQMVSGIRRRDGTYVDRGTGLSKQTVITAIKGLLEKGVIRRQRNRSVDRGDEATTYAIRLAGDPLDDSAQGSNLQTPPVQKLDTGTSQTVSKSLTGPVQTVDPPAQSPVSKDQTGGVQASDTQHDNKQELTVPRENRKDQTSQEKDADGLTARELWDQALRLLSHTLSPGEYQNWVQTAKPLARTASTLTIIPRGTTAHEWLEGRLRTPIEQALSGVAGRRVSLQIVDRGTTSRKTPPARSRYIQGPQERVFR